MAERLENKVRSSEIGKAKPKIILGSICVLLSATFVFIMLTERTGGGGLLLQSFAVAVLLYFAYVNFSGYCRVKCPYCEKDIHIKRLAQNAKCEFCKSISVRKGDILEEVIKN